MAGRVLSSSQIALYLGALFLIGGSLFYFVAHRFYDAVRGVLQPFIVLAVPFVGLNFAAHTLARRDHRAVSVAFYLAGVTLLPLFLLIVFHETGIWLVKPHTLGQIFTDGSVSNRQLQITILVACAWACWWAFRTRIAALTTVFGLLLLLLSLAVLGDFGLRSWVEDEKWHLLALHLAPLVVVYAAGRAALQRSRPWFAPPMFIAAALVPIGSLELLPLNAGVLNASAALWLVADHRQWFDKPRGAMALIKIGLAALATGFWLSSEERARSRPGSQPDPTRDRHERCRRGPG